MSHRTMALLGCILLIAGCGGGDQEAEPEETVFDPLVETLDRAGAVDELARDRRQQLDSAVDESER